MSTSQGELNHHPTARIFGKVRKRFQSLGNRALAICAATAAVACLLTVLRLPPFVPELSDVESRLQDHYFLLRNYLWPKGEWKNSAAQEVVLVSIDEESARKMGQKDLHQWPKRTFAELIKKLNGADAGVIVLDIPLDATTELKADASAFDETVADSSKNENIRSTVSSDPDNQALLDQLKLSHNVILTSGIDRTSTFTPVITSASTSTSSPQSTSTSSSTTSLKSTSTSASTSTSTSATATATAAKSTSASKLATTLTPTDETRDNSLILLRSPGAPFVEAVGEDSGSVGNNVIIADPDGMVRHGAMLFDQLGPSFYKSVALRVIEKHMGVRSNVDDRGFVYLRDRLLPASVRINYAGPPGSFRAIPMWRALDWEQHAQRGWFGSSARTANDSVNASNSALEVQNPFKDKIVIVGFFEPSQPGVARNHYSFGNSVTTYLTPAAPPPAAMNGVEVHANLIANILHKNFIAEPDLWEVLLFEIFAGLLIGRVMARCASRPWLSLFWLTVISAVWLAVSFYAFVALKMLIPNVVPVVGVAWPAAVIVLCDQYYKIKRERAKQTKLFRSLAAKPLANEIERKLLAELGLTGKLMTVTVAACQLHDFSRELDNRPPEQVLQSLNQCLGIMMATIGEHGGLVERVWNCGVIGLWGAPIAMNEAAQAHAAAKCLTDIRARLRVLSGSETLDKSPFGLTCAINTGEAICGTIDAGSKTSSLVQYGALGPSVELAMQLDALHPQFGSTCILGASTAALLADRAEVRELDRIAIGGRTESQSVYELLSVDGTLSAVREEAMDLYRQGRKAFEDGRFREAEQLFSTCASMVPSDKATAIMLDRCRTVLAKSEAKQI